MSAVEHIGGFARFALNDVGRDFVVGDLHGCLEDLEKAMAAVQFNTQVDRLFSVGDLVDRGPHSMELLELHESSDWFHAVRGNHDMITAWVAQQVIDRLYAEDDVRLGAEERMHIDTMDAQWIVEVVDQIREGKRHPKELTTLLSPASWPLAIEVETQDGPIALLHADPCASHWPEVVARLSTDRIDERDVDAVVWGRQGILKAWKKIGRNGKPNAGITMADIQIPGIHCLYSGHTPVDNPPFRVGNRAWIDSGAIFGCGEITLHRVHEPPMANRPAENPSQSLAS